MTRTGKPFDEANKRWAKKTEMNTTFIEDPTRFMESLRYNDFSVLDKLQVLHTVNTDYAKFKIFPAAEGFCISIENFRKTRTKNNGVTKYDGEKLCQYLMISKDAGSKLLSRSMLDNDSKATARIVGKRARWKEKLRIILIFFATGIFLFCGYMALVAGENAGEMLRHPIAVVVSAAFVLIFLLSLVGSYLKEDVILLEDNELDASWMPPDATTGKHHVKKRDRGLGYKIYFTLMSIISIVIFIFTVIS
ncbi:MAG: hypothetical protein FWD93_00085 [Coriobacteriia bacterium]|nr:hypothetical protein [Coriobacteriia bacterium]MCL2605665.1 hypothetical protein [Coriobacteriia bacterium]